MISRGEAVAKTIMTETVSEGNAGIKRQGGKMSYQGSSPLRYEINCDESERENLR